MAYVEITDAQVTVDEFGVDTTLFQRLRNNIREVRSAIFAVVTGEVSTAVGSPTWTELYRFTLAIPNVADYTGIARLLTVILDAKVDAGTGILRLTDNATATSDDEVNITATSYGTDYTLTLTVDAGWINTTRTILIEGQAPGGSTVYAKSEDRVTARLDY